MLKSFVNINPSFRTLVQRRLVHSTPSTQPAKILIFPITKEKPYLHFEYNENLINTNSPLVKYEDKLVKLAAKGWKSITDSDKSYNKKIVHYINKFLQRTPWSEDSLRSIPSTSALLRQIQRTTDNEETKEIILKAPAELTNANGFKVLDIPVYYPSALFSSDQAQSEILHLAQQGKVYHRRQMLINAILIPFTIPFIVLPVVPNIPGFYLAYRFYCNLKAYLGAEHLQELIEQKHFQYIESSDINEIYAPSENKSENRSDILLNESVIEQINQRFETPKSLNSILLKALKQERKSNGN